MWALSDCVAAMPTLSDRVNSQCHSMALVQQLLAQSHCTRLGKWALHACRMPGPGSTKRLVCDRKDHGMPLAAARVSHCVCLCKRLLVSGSWVNHEAKLKCKTIVQPDGVGCSCCCWRCPPHVADFQACMVHAVMSYIAACQAQHFCSLVKCVSSIPE